MKIIFWIFTVLLILMMLFSAYGAFFPTPEGETMMKQIGYPYSVLKLLAVLKVLGSIALVVPGFPRLKEWAYAGFTFDLIGAAFAFLAIGASITDVWFMALGLLFLFISYFSYHKLNAKTV